MNTNTYTKERHMHFYYEKKRITSKHENIVEYTSI